MLSSFSIILSNVKLLQTCLSISSSLHGNGVINLTIDNDKITSTTANAIDSCYKHWELSIDQIGTIKDKAVLEKPIKCSIFKGSDFSNKILNQLIQKDVISVMTFYYDNINFNVKQIEITCISTKTRKKVFSFKFNTSDVALIFTEFDDETIEFFFSDKSSAKEIYEFKLMKDDVKTLRSMMNLNVHDDSQNNYISIKFDKSSEQIILTDEITDFRLSEDSLIKAIPDEISELKFDISKTVFKEIDNANLIVKIKEFEGSKFISVISTNPEINYITTIPLLEEIQSSISYEDILKDQGKFG